MGQNSNSDYGSGCDDEESDYFRTFATVEKDNKHEFIRVFNRLDPDDQAEIVLSICSYDAANCLAAILDGEAGDESTINYFVSGANYNIPLHKAARRATPRIASVLLDKGFSADLRADPNIGSRYIYLKNALPLNVSLDYARFRLWKDDRFKSPIHQIIHLFKMPPLAITIRLIARNTKEIKHEFLKYLKQGKVFEVGALLAIASDLIMSSSSANDGENNGSVGFKNIMEMRQFLLAEMSRSLGASNTQLKEMRKTLRLLEIFDRVGDKLVAHMPMWDDLSASYQKDVFQFWRDYNTDDSGNRVASLIKDAAYDEKEEVQYDHDAVPRAYYSHLGSLPASYYGGVKFPFGRRKFSTNVHFPSRLEEGSSHVDIPFPLPINVKGAVTKYVLLKKHASFTGAFVKAVRHLRYR